MLLRLLIPSAFIFGMAGTSSAVVALASEAAPEPEFGEVRTIICGLKDDTGIVQISEIKTRISNRSDEEICSSIDKARQEQQSRLSEGQNGLRKLRSELNNLCPIYTFGEWAEPSEYMKPKYWYKYYYLSDLDGVYSNAFSRLDKLYLTFGELDQMREEIAQSYGRCMERVHAQHRSHGDYVLRGWRNVSCASCKPSFSDLALHSPRSLLLQGLSKLASTDVEKQDWVAASELIRDANSNLVQIQRDYQSQVRDYYAKKGQAVRQRARISAATQILSGVILGEMGAGTGQVIDTTVRNLAEIDRSTSAKLDAIRDSGFRASYIPVSGQYSDDGFRVTIPRFRFENITYRGDAHENYRTEKNFYSGTGALSGLFPLSVITRIATPNGGYCTGAFVGRRLVLTNKHCVVDQSGEVRHASVRYEWMTYAHLDDNALIEGDIAFFSTETVVAPPGDHNADRRHDWAIIVLRDDGRYWYPGYLGFRNVSKMSKSDWRVAVAGYSSDLNDGSQITMDWGCTASLRDEKIFHKCRSWKGSSGSPIVAVNLTNNRRTVIGVHAAGPVENGPGIRIGASSQEMFDTISRLREKYK